jgi:hypothetical protein
MRKDEKSMQLLLGVMQYEAGLLSTLCAQWMREHVYRSLLSEAGGRVTSKMLLDSAVIRNWLLEGEEDTTQIKKEMIGQREFECNREILKTIFGVPEKLVCMEKRGMVYSVAFDSL